MNLALMGTIQSESKSVSHSHNYHTTDYQIDSNRKRGIGEKNFSRKPRDHALQISIPPIPVAHDFVSI